MRKEQQQDQDARPDHVDERGEVQESFTEGPDQGPEVANDQEEEQEEIVS